jgi:hypothetical protein
MLAPRPAPRLGKRAPPAQPSLVARRLTAHPSGAFFVFFFFFFFVLMVTGLPFASTA